MEAIHTLPAPTVLGARLVPQGTRFGAVAPGGSLSISYYCQKAVPAVARLALLYAVKSPLTVVSSSDQKVRQAIEDKLQKWGIQPGWAMFVAIPIKILEMLKQALTQKETVSRAA